VPGRTGQTVKRTKVPAMTNSLKIRSISLLLLAVSACGIGAVRADETTNAAPNHPFSVGLDAGTTNAAPNHPISVGLDAGTTNAAPYHPISVGLDAGTTNAAPYHPFSVGLDAGTAGLGGSVAWRFEDHLGARAGLDYFSYSRHATIQDVAYSGTLRPMSEVLTLNLYPWTKSSFYVGVGAFFNQNNLTGSASDANGITLDGTFYPAGQVGTLHLKVDQQPVNPYVSVGGNLYFGKAHHWSLAGELGVAYAGKPRVDLTRSGGVVDPNIDLAVAQQRQKVENQIKDFQFWPVLKLGVTYSF